MKTAERVSFASPALLGARDLAGVLAHELALARAHVRGVHDTWGIALGFELTRTQQGAVVVGPGLAWDCRGRAILSAAAFLAHPPEADAGQVELLIAWDPDAETERPSWRWWRLGRDRPARLGEEISLGRFSIVDALPAALDPAPRRHVPWPAPPQIGSGRVEQAAAGGSLGAWSLTVDTTAAAFAAPPLYFATLEGDPLGGVEGVEGVHGPFLSIRSASATEFVLDVRHAAPGGLPAHLRSTGAFALPVPVGWIGVLVRTACSVEEEHEPEVTPA